MASLIEYTEGGVISKQLIKSPAGNMPLLIGVASAAVAGLVALTAFALRRKKMNVRAEALTNGKNKKKKEDNSQNL